MAPATTTAAEAGKFARYHEAEACFTALTLILQQRNPEPAPKSNLKQTSPVESAKIISPSGLVVVRALGACAVPHILASAHPFVPYPFFSGSGAWGRVIMAQISNSNSLAAVKVLPKKEFRLTGEVRISQTLTLFEGFITLVSARH